MFPLVLSFLAVAGIWYVIQLQQENSRINNFFTAADACCYRDTSHRVTKLPGAQRRENSQRSQRCESYDEPSDNLNPDGYGFCDDPAGYGYDDYTGQYPDYDD
jgi:hypothetical protein